MSATRTKTASLLACLAFSCGSGGTSGPIDPVTGGSVCAPNDSVCFEVDPGGLDRSAVFRVAPGTEAPPAIIGPAWDISVSGDVPTFVKPAHVSFKLDELPFAEAGVEDETILRVYTTQDGDWVPLDNPVVDRVQGRVRGDTTHLSPFAVLRRDRLPDGGPIIGTDAGPGPDSGMIVIPPIPDAGHDAGVDAGTPDAGALDAGTPDAGPADAGAPDAGPADAGVDAGTDAGVDAGVDAGSDAGVDAGLDAGPDAGVDAGAADAGDDAGVGGDM